ncbi:LD-carboxypeptidase LdcB [Salinibacillus aidingensis]|uniref:LD-carboxypeptidase LdcB n=1 Tax=Salinibacillus aidingensis TaxID=237684 RepID=A0ABN1B5E4_9BACI
MKIKYSAAVIMLVVMTLTACQNQEVSQDQEKQSANTEQNQQENQNEEKSSENEQDQDTETNKGESGEQTSEDSEMNEGSKGSDQETEDKKNANDKNEKPDENGIVTLSDPTAIDLVVNKQRKLPDGFVPPDLVEPDVRFSFDEWREKRQMRQVAAGPLEKLFKGAKQAGINLFAVSGYRSYQRQETIYNYNVETKGLEHANKYSAKPGHSEHQTGLTMDVSSPAVSYDLVEGFRDTAAGEWLAKHAHEYGFIIRYPKGKADITGYSYEPWHIRYVGKELAKDIYEQQVTLEEFFGLQPGAGTDEK